MTLRTSQDNSAAIDAVSILDVDGNQVLRELRPLAVNVVRGSNKFTHPLENNATRADHKIITPVQVEYRAIIQAEEYQETYNELERLFIDSTELLVQTRARTFDRMIILSIPHNEDPSLFDALSIVVTLEETQIGRTVIAAINPLFSTVNRGQVQPGATSGNQDSQGSAAFSLLRSVGGA